MVFGRMWVPVQLDEIGEQVTFGHWTCTSQNDTSERLRTMATTDAGWTVFSNGIEDLSWRCSLEVGFESEN